MAGACIARGHGGGHAWQGVHVAGGHAQGCVCMVGSACVSGGQAWWGACMARGHTHVGGVHDRRVGHSSGRYASCLNPFLFLLDQIDKTKRFFIRDNLSPFPLKTQKNYLKD